MGLWGFVCSARPAGVALSISHPHPAPSTMIGKGNTGRYVSTVFNCTRVGAARLNVPVEKGKSSTRRLGRDGSGIVAAFLLFRVRELADKRIVEIAASLFFNHRARVFVSPFLTKRAEQAKKKAKKRRKPGLPQWATDLEGSIHPTIASQHCCVCVCVSVCACA